MKKLVLAAAVLSFGVLTGCSSYTGVEAIDSAQSEEYSAEELEQIESEFAHYEATSSDLDELLASTEVVHTMSPGDKVQFSNGIVLNTADQTHFGESPYRPFPVLVSSELVDFDPRDGENPMIYQRPFYFEEVDGQYNEVESITYNDDTTYELVHENDYGQVVGTTYNHYLNIDPKSNFAMTYYMGTEVAVVYFESGE